MNAVSPFALLRVSLAAGVSLRAALCLEARGHCIDYLASGCMVWLGSLWGDIADIAHTHMHPHTRARDNAHAHTHTHARTHAHTHTHARTHAHTHTHTRTRIRAVALTRTTKGKDRIEG